MSAEAVLQLRDVTETYPGPLTVLHGIDLTIAPGEAVAIVGPSGSGKTTLLHIMGTLDRATSGAVSIAGRDVGSLPDRELAALRAFRIGFVFQQFFLVETLTALENVAAGLLYTGLPRSDRATFAVDALDRVGLAARRGHLAKALSGGERQRVAIARALLGSPAVVFADEPTGNLDTKTGTEIVRLLHGLNDDGTTVVTITHDPDVAAAMSRKVTLRDGRIVGGRA
jgi:putative ABC transport system ATP-binding protein